MTQKLCARCEGFSVKDHPEKEKAGLGLCKFYSEHAEQFTRWDAPFCVLYSPAKQMGPRNRWIEIRIESEKA